jgi:outer membrane protein assembly factor BamB
MQSLVLFIALLGAETDDNWPGFLGAGESAANATSVPLTWSPEKNIAWTAKLPGDGQSSPVVWNGTAYVTSLEGEMKERLYVTAISVKEGREKWRQAFDSHAPEKNSLYISRAAPTPVVDEQGVYAYFESGDVVAIDHAGQVRWTKSLADEYGKPKNKFGLAASPVQTKDAVIVLVDDEGPSYLVALAKADGRTLWKTDRTSRTSWSSPFLIPVGDSQQVVVSSAGSVDGYDPTTGKLLWSYSEVGGNTAATPIAYANGSFLVGASVGRENEQRAENAKKSNLAMRIEQVDGQWTPKVLWRTEQATPSFGSPMVYRGYAYWVNRQGVVYCFDAATGEAKYTQRTKQSVWATPVGIGDRVYLFGKDGLTTVIAAGPEFKVLAENQLWDPAAVKPDPAQGAKEDSEEKRRSAAMFSGPVQYGVAVTGGSLLIRTGNALYCVRE